MTADLTGEPFAAERAELIRQKTANQVVVGDHWLDCSDMHSKGCLIEEAGLLDGVAVTFICEREADHVGAHVASIEGKVVHAWTALRLREGDQPLPVLNDRPDIQSQLIADIEERRQVGIRRYGTALQPFNGRDAARDLYEELIDGAVYAKQLVVEHADMNEELEALRQETAELLSENQRLTEERDEALRQLAARDD